MYKGIDKMKIGNIGTHATHCCKTHGCKYGNLDCPVALGIVKQEYPCEDCDHDEKYGLSAKINQLLETEKLYYELLWAVESKTPGESRHETALRYIQESERGSDNGAKQEVNNG